MASPTILIGLFIAVLMRYYLGPEHTRRLFGGDSLRSLPQSWLLGMLMPVCSLGVIPIIREMHRVKNSAGRDHRLCVIRAFVQSAFALVRFDVVATLCDRWICVGFVVGGDSHRIDLGSASKGFIAFGVGRCISVHRLARLQASWAYAGRELLGATGRFTLIAMLGVGLLAVVLPHGALQTSAEQVDPWSPLRMAMLSVPVYATPMQTISQLGMMFAHGNSPGAAFCLLLWAPV